MIDELSSQPEGTRILIAEDEPGLQEAFAIILELEGYQVMRASNGREALQRLSENRPDLVVTDYMMPRMNGGELIEAIRRDSKLIGIPILLLSAALPRHVDPSIADQYLPKPVHMARLLEAVERLTKKRRDP